MTDKDRMDVVDKVYNEILNYRNLTVYFTRKNVNVSFLRAQKTTIRNGSKPCTGITINIGSHVGIIG